MTQIALLKAGDLTPGEWHDLIAGLAVPEPDAGRLVLWAEAPDGWALDAWGGFERHVHWYAAGRLAFNRSGREVIEAAHAGRVFAPGGELRWRLIPALGERCYRVVFLGDHDWLPDRLSPRAGLEGLTYRDDHALHWGQRTESTPDAWVELRIPHRLHYPVSPPGAPPRRPVGVRARLEVWSDAWGEPHFVRLRELIPFTPEEDA